MNDADFGKYAVAIERRFAELEKENEQIVIKLSETRSFVKGIALRVGISADQLKDLEEFVHLEVSRNCLNIRNEEGRL